MKSLSGKGQGNLDLEMYNRFFKDIKHGICLECGAMDGINLSVCRFFELYCGWKCINIEASPKSFAQLKDNRPQSINLNYALSNYVGKIMFRENHRPKNGCVKDDLTLAAYGSRFDRGQIVEVECMTYKYLINNILMPQYSIDHIDLFVLDVESHEVKVTEGMTGAKILPSVLCSEISYYKPEIIEQIKKNLPGYNVVFNIKYNYVFVQEKLQGVIL